MNTALSIPKLQRIQNAIQYRFILVFAVIRSKDVLQVDGKKAFLDEMIGHFSSKQIKVRKD
jgi:hypothetical protein